MTPGTRRTLILITLTAALLSGGAAVASSAEAPAGDQRGTIGLRLIDVPPEQLDDPRSTRYIVDRISPGASFGRRFLVTNSTGHPLDVRVYPAGVAVEDGVFVVRDELESRIVAWMDVSPEQVTIPPSEGQAVDVSFDVPPDAPEGEHVAVVLAEVRSGADANEIEVVSRLGMRVYLSVGEGEAPAANFSVLDMTAGRAEDGTPYVDVQVHNSGGRTVDLHGELELLDGPSGLRAGPVGTSGPVTLLPGDTASPRFVFGEDLPDGPWTARAELRSGLLERVATATITFPAAPGEESTPAEAEMERQRRLLIPVALGLLLLLMALLYVAWRAQRRVPVPPGRSGGAPTARADL